MIEMMHEIINFVYYKFIRPSRLKKEIKKVNKLSGTNILDIGYFDGTARKMLRKNMDYYGIDVNPREKLPEMPTISIEDFSTEKKFDIVIAFDVLEHTKDPVLAIKKIKSLSKKYVCVSVPHEPMYTLSRLFVPVEDHFWTIHPNILEYYLGKPIYAKKIHCFRTYFAIYDLSN